MFKRWINSITDAVNYIGLLIKSRIAKANDRKHGHSKYPKQNRPRLLILPDARGWAFDDWAQQRAKHMASAWDVDIQYIHEKPGINPGLYDLMFDPNWHFNEYDALFMGRYVRGINSHKWELGLRPYAQLRASLKGAVACFVCSKALLERIQPVFYPTYHVKSGVDPGIFYWIKDRSEPNLIAGWVGNLNSTWKRLETVIKPACSLANVELRIATNLSKENLNLFYNEVDIILIGSEPLEGDPVPLYEAGACGRAVIATRVGSVPEIIEDEVNGFIVEATGKTSDIINTFVERLNWCKEHLPELRNMGKIHRERVLEDRAADKTSEQFMQAVERAYARIAARNT